MNKLVKKVTGVILLVALLVTTAGTSAQAAKEVKWPYGTYKCTIKGFKNYRIDWEYASDPSVKYDQLIYLYVAGDRADTEELIQMKRVKTNTYRSKVEISGSGNEWYYKLTVTKNSVTLKQLLNGKAQTWFSYGKNGGKKLKFKIKKRLSKNVG